MIEIQNQVISTLKAAMPLKEILSYVPENKEPPYVHVSYLDSDENDTDTETGFVSEILISVYSRYRGMKEAADLQKQVYDALHRVTLPDTDSFGISTIQQEFSNIVTDSDGLTRIGLQRFTIIFEPLP